MRTRKDEAGSADRGKATMDLTDSSNSNDGEKSSRALTDWEVLDLEIAKDRRKEKRVFLRFQVEVSGFDPAGNLFRANGFTTDISATGCQVAIDEYVERGDIVAMKLLTKSEPNAPVSKPQRFQILWRERKENVWTVGALKLTGEKFWQVDSPENSPFKAA
jgi:hypothetical protein